MRTSSFSLKSFEIRDRIEQLCRADNDSSTADFRTRSYYYRRRRPLIWVDRMGVDSRADTLLHYLKTVAATGFTLRSFNVAAIERDLHTARTLAFDTAYNSAPRVMARLEYRLTKAYFRFVIGQRFGYVNPLYVFNRMDVLSTDSAGRPQAYRRLFDIPVERPGDAFMQRAVSMAFSDSLGAFLAASRPTDPQYYRLQRMLPAARSARERMLILCNMERHRWRVKSLPDTAGRRYVVVNIPAYHLYAYGGDSVLDMRIGCGSTKTKTPLLVSAFYRMDLNPVWNMPMSIVRKDIVRHAGSSGWFASRRYYIVERATGRRVDPSQVSAAMLQSGAYRVSQQGGEGNALGRIIFRFNNNFSVYLHDTSSRGVFEQQSRDVSHGCVRVERPFDLAAWLLGNPDDEWLLDKIRITMGLPPLTERGRRYLAARKTDANAGSAGVRPGDARPDSPRLVGSLDVRPQVPLFMVYYTLWPDASGTLRSWPDVYGFDRRIEQNIKLFMK